MFGLWLHLGLESSLGVNEGDGERSQLLATLGLQFPFGKCRVQI